MLWSTETLQPMFSRNIDAIKPLRSSKEDIRILGVLSFILFISFISFCEFCIYIS